MVAAGRRQAFLLAAHAQLRLAHPLARDLRRPWERPAELNRLTRSSWPRAGVAGSCRQFCTRRQCGRPLEA
ncbi:hypothetical protein DTB58_01355 [Streptomyces griseus]|nr:hypothetical protein [Streptomyces griseus]